jgi:hypothetical protein
MFLYQRTAMLSSMATAAVLMLVAVPLLMRDKAPSGYAAERMTVKSVRSYQPATVAPVVMGTDNGSAIIWMVDEDDDDSEESDELELDSPPKKGPIGSPNPVRPEPPAPKGGAL